MKLGGCPVFPNAGWEGRTVHTGYFGGSFGEFPHFCRKRDDLLSVPEEEGPWHGLQ